MESPFRELLRSDFFKVFDYRCDCDRCGTGATEYTEAFTLSFPRKGFFLFNSYRRQFEARSGVVLLEKPGTEYSVTHVCPFPDNTTCIVFEGSFFQRLLEAENLRDAPFFRDPDRHALALSSKPHWELLHHLIVRAALHGGDKGSLEPDCLVLELLLDMLATLRDEAGAVPLEVPAALKKAHAETIEKAKFFLSEHFGDALSLSGVARYANVSPFHFARIFKAFTGLPPHRYLLQQRLHYASLLLRNQRGRVSEVAFQAGFNSTEHFTASFSKHFGASPAAFRAGKKQDF